ncbi:MAG: carboxypeptidase regulatory-like domain-containing protein [Nitrospirae bacterium]|nr:carboxypeptidase regulatory-like domain-containing protein [Nitrospirota bacterium]
MMNKSILSALGALAIFVLCSGFAPGVFTDPNASTVTGEIGIKGVGPMMGGLVFFYHAESGPPPSATKYWLVPAYSFKLDQNSRFTAKLPEGTYYMGAIERSSGEALGPPAEGDYFFISSDKKGNPKMLTVWKNSVINLGLINEAEKFSRASLAKKGITSVEGTIRDEEGKPVKGMAVYAYATPEMLEKPLFVSDPSDQDGKYVLRVNRGGKYYLMARVGYGGGPLSPEELAGVYKDGKPVSIKTGENRKGIHISVFKIIMSGHSHHF